MVKVRELNISLSAWVISETLVLELRGGETQKKRLWENPCTFLTRGSLLLIAYQGSVNQTLLAAKLGEPCAPMYKIILSSKSYKKKSAK